ncbi:hypothetical protein P170DRAFT_462695 [Aspergillus steynii IBT 23096]|uniref:Uncharacterized protein n=1 Tax=Aspergillus steynii IBT 23096 TaxID=1392250 RepID=A0A2I2GIZ7_9EURO|nr:uncharacterized protein P170DRAFT_462695 [Aspergillus steynii IBT 23096]PLB52851.1 hypothetical protein P170DRAFT_462695 [Aspergillus steynii IBT 23096]
MPTPERKSGWSRRAFEPPQDHRSPFRRAHLESRATDRVDASHIPSPSNASTARRRRNYSQTGTLRGAFEAISRYPTMSDNEDFSTDPYALGTPNRRQQSFNPASPDSNPPNELAETYRQIDDAGSLIDFDAPEDEDVYIPRTQFRGSRSRGSSLGSTRRDHGLFTHTDANYLEDTTDNPYRRNSRDPVRDEQRLRRATSSRSPVLNRTGTANALTSENLQRREEEEAHMSHMSEEDDGFKPTLNLPTNWGSRGTHRRDWLRDITRRKEPETKEAVEEPAATSPPKFNLDLASRSSHLEQTNNVNRATTDERQENRYSRVPLSDAQNNLSTENRAEKLTGGDQIPNTPIMVYKNSTFTKRSPTKRDSHDLLRKLSRTESPNQPQRLSELRTPEGPKMPENRIYDKTPVVTGAWIDTPVTERADRFPDHLSKDIVPSQVKKDQPPSAPQQPQSQVAEQTVGSGLQSQKEQERETELRKDREKAESERKEREKKESDMKSQEERKSEQRKDDKKKENQTDKPKDTQKPPLIKPDLPKSALETVMQDFKADKDRLDVGDDTIESLQLILDEQPNEMKTEAEEDAAYEKSVMEKLELAGSKGRDVVDLDGLNEKLRAFSENINRVKTGLAGLEKQVDLIPTSKKDMKSGRNRASDGCETCRTHHHDHTSSAIPLPLLWKRDAVTQRVRPTGLAWFIVLLFAWSYAESTMCDYYCHPIAANVCEGNCLLRDAPQFPFVLPTMLWRWSRLSGVLAPVWALLLALFKLAGQLMGFWDGYVDEAPRAYNLSGEIRIRGSQTRDFAVTATPTRGLFGFGAPKQQDGIRYNSIPEPVPESVPELDLNQNPAGASNDDGSMDDDEYI